MERAKPYEDYPAWIILTANLFSIATWLAGAFIIWQALGIWVILYLLFIGYLEVRLLMGHCVDCYYYGKMCANGNGRLSSLFFRKGDPKNFCKRQMGWKDIAPDFMVSVIPMIIGAWILITSFSWLILSLVILFFCAKFSWECICPWLSRVQVLQAEGARVPCGKIVQQEEVI